MQKIFDSIVVGAGSSGSVVAGELAANPQHRVLVLEHGDAAARNPEILEAGGYKKAFVNDRVMWERFSEPQSSCLGKRLFMGTGMGVGGSGSVNAMVYTRGSEFDYSMWEVDGWRWRDVVPAFEKLEAKLRISCRPPTRFTEACIDAAESAGFRRKADLNDGVLSGYLGYEWMNIDGDKRRSSYVSFLRPVEGHDNVRLVTNARCRRVLFDESRRAIGVEYESDGRIFIARARHEVVLCAGALETPKLLMLSGIGPADELRAHGITAVAENAAVGRNLMDHPNVQVFWKGKQETDCDWAQLYGFHRANPALPLPPGEADTCYVFYSARSSFKEGLLRLVPGMAIPQPLYQLGWPVGLMRAGLRGVFGIPGVQRFVNHLYGIVVILGKPQSRGTVRLRSAQVKDQALLDPNYFAVQADLDAMVAGVKLARRVAAAPALQAWGNLELLPGKWVSSDRAIARFVKQQAMTTYHFAGTCKMGEGRESVVDARLRVRGVNGLRVADASVIPSVPVSAMNAPSMMIGYRAAQFMMEEMAGKKNVAAEETIYAR